MQISSRCNVGNYTAISLHRREYIRLYICNITCDRVGGIQSRGRSEEERGGARRIKRKVFVEEDKGGEKGIERNVGYPLLSIRACESTDSTQGAHRGTYHQRERETELD